MDGLSILTDWLYLLMEGSIVDIKTDDYVMTRFDDELVLVVDIENEDVIWTKSRFDDDYSQSFARGDIVAVYRKVE